MSVKTTVNSPEDYAVDKESWYQKTGRRSDDIYKIPAEIEELKLTASSSIPNISVYLNDATSEVFIFAGTQLWLNTSMSLDTMDITQFDLDNIIINERFKIIDMKTFTKYLIDYTPLLNSCLCSSCLCLLSRDETHQQDGEDNTLNFGHTAEQSHPPFVDQRMLAICVRLKQYFIYLSLLRFERAKINWQTEKEVELRNELMKNGGLLGPSIFNSTWSVLKD